MSQQPYLSTEDTRLALQQEAMQRSMFFAQRLAESGVDRLLNRVDALARDIDTLAWRQAANSLGIDLRALDVLDRVPIRYPCYFCTPAQLAEDPSLVAYYRNLAMLSVEAMRDIGLDTAEHEAGALLLAEKAERLAVYLNSIVSARIIAEPMLVTPRRHLELVFANLGESIGNAWRQINE